VVSWPAHSKVHPRLKETQKPVVKEALSIPTDNHLPQIATQVS